MFLFSNKLDLNQETGFTIKLLSLDLGLSLSLYLGLSLRLKERRDLEGRLVLG